MQLEGNGAGRRGGTFTATELRLADWVMMV